MNCWNTGVELPKHVEDYVNKLTELRKNTGLKILSYDWDTPMITDDNTDILYFPIWDEAMEAYHVELEARQGLEIKAAGSIEAYIILHQPEWDKCKKGEIV